ncbi:HNH endonuclease [Terrabacter sp. Ter38]|uniref:HNH endonuclease n=1 Tax=Terrabacter sp. Ter38 TaxID=2926030 RepID=UPI002119AA13|nr:HNH endonuclease [Terrabacter sp. Ter38]
MFEQAIDADVRRADPLGVFVDASPATSALIREASGIDHGDLADADLISAIDALERVKAACAAAQARLTARFVESQAQVATRLRAEAQARSDAGDFDGWVAARDRARALELGPSPSETQGRRRAPSRSDRRMTLSRTGVSAQVGLARRESPFRGARLANASVALVQHLHHTLEALGAGVLNERRAEIVVRCTSHLDPELRAQVDSEVVGAHLDLTDPTAPGGVGSWGDRELERRLRACADRLDAVAAVERCRIAENERRVSIRPVPDAMALVTAVLPVAQAVAVHAALTRAALSGKAAGDERGKGQLMADTLVELVTGRSVADDVPVEVQVVITDRALMAGDEIPAHVPGYGSVPAAWVRELLTRRSETEADDRAHRATIALRAGQSRTEEADGSEPRESRNEHTAKVWVRRLFTHPSTGTLVAMDSTRRLFPPALRRFVVTRDGTCRTPWCDAPIAHADHVEPHADGGPTSAANGQGLCVRCNLVKEEPGWCSEVVHDGLGPTDARTHTVRTTTPTGHRYGSTAPPLLPMRPPAAARPRARGPAPDGRAEVIRLELYRRTDLEVELTG